MSKIRDRVELDPRVINWSTAEDPAFEDWDQYPRESVRKIVIGPSPGGADDEGIELNIEELLRRLPDFRNLTHLYLWKVKGLNSVRGLPSSLRCLDLRGCDSLQKLPALPASLTSLILDGCSSLAKLEPLNDQSLPYLREGSFKGCSKIPEAWLGSLLGVSKELRFIDFSGCAQLEGLKRWPSQLERIELNDCTGLRTLPGEWPDCLRRLGLRGASALKEMPEELPMGIDYLDLAYMEGLKKLPEGALKARTLFLYGSGIQRPPASEHGEGEHENVAESCKEYFDDLELAGKGQVRRCKLLLLGNGGAGKTSLALALNDPDGDPAIADAMGSTHGVQFFDSTWNAPICGTNQDVQLHLWDFGGQEIYHNTHQLFMSKGSVFLVLWYPEQDGKQPAKTESGYQDQWRPLQYWIDLISISCPKPRIALVCSHTAEETKKLRNQWEDQVSLPEGSSLRCFYIDSKERRGQLQELRNWVTSQVANVVESQGTEVPVHWEVAQQMVNGWFKKSGKTSPFAQQHPQIEVSEFTKALRSAIDRAPDLAKFKLLREKVDRGAFVLTPRRVERVLSFLTHSGWVYWNPSLFEERILVDQKWALDGIYTVLDRGGGSIVYKHLLGNHGRFLPSDLARNSWNAAGFSPSEQNLLLSFMQKCRLCFKLRDASDAWRDEDVYVSFEHLPSAEEIGLEGKFTARKPDLPKPCEPIEEPIKGFHRLHWQRFLSSAGEHYGSDADYASNGFYVETEDDHKILVTCEWASSGLDARLRYSVMGGDSRDRLASVRGLVRALAAPRSNQPPPEPSAAMGAGSKRIQVFISYTWDDEKKRIAQGYERPVDEIERQLQDSPFHLIRDKNVISDGGDIKRFMDEASRHPFVIIVHSDKYWKSEWCMYELKRVYDELSNEAGRSLDRSIISVEHLNSGITEADKCQAYVEYWRQVKTCNVGLEWSLQEMREEVPTTVRKFARYLGKAAGRNLQWTDGDSTVLQKILKRLKAINNAPE